MDKYYCPECGRECFTLLVNPGQVAICRDMGHWVGHISYCLSLEQAMDKFTIKLVVSPGSSEYAWW